jgi:cytosine/uracil/thiamine/allantoin permease
VYRRNISFPFLIICSLIKAVIVPVAWIAILIWAMVKVPPSISLGNQPASVSGTALTWAWLSSLNSALGNYAPLAVNIPDFTVGCMNIFLSCVNVLCSGTLKMSECKTLAVNHFTNVYTYLAQAIHTGCLDSDTIHPHWLCR